MRDSILWDKMKHTSTKIMFKHLWIGILIILQISGQSLQTENARNYYIEMVMSIRESTNGTCAEIKEDTIQLVAAFYYAMSVISRAETYPKIRYFTVGVDFCEIVNNYQTRFQITKKYFKAFLSPDGNQTVFESEFRQEKKNEEIIDTTTDVPTTEAVSKTENFEPTSPTTQGNFVLQKGLRIIEYVNNFLSRKNATKTIQRARVVKLNITRKTTTSAIPSTEATTTNITGPIKELEIEWFQQKSMYFNISRDSLKSANPQLTALTEAVSTFSVFKDLFLDDYTLNNVPIISNNFEFPPHEAELQVVLGDLLECHQWTIVSVIYSRRVAEKERYVNFLKNFQDVCVSEQIGITEDSPDSDYDHLVWLLHTNIRNTNVIVCFCNRKEIEKLMQAVSRYDVCMPFTFIFVQDGLMKQLNFTTGFEEQLLNSYIIGRDIDYVEEFTKIYLEDYFTVQRLHPWAADYKRQNDLAMNVTTNDTNYNETAQQFLSNFVVNPEVKGIIMGIFAVDAVIRTFLDPGEDSKYYNRNVTFMEIWNDVKKGLNSHEKDLRNNFLSFNKLKVAKFEKFQAGNTTSYNYILINDTLSDCLNDKEIPLHFMSLNIPLERSTVFKYLCVESCPHGYESISKNVHCLIYDSNDDGWEKVRNCTECVKFPEEDVYGHLMMIPMLISVMGLFLTSIVAQTFVMHHRNTVVRTTLYLSAIMLGCMLVVHSIVILISLKICLFTCGVFKYVIPMCFTVMYSAMLVKINRMYRAWEVPPYTEVVSVPNISSKKSAVILMSILVSFESIMIFVHLTLGKEKIFHEEYISTGYEFNLDRLCPLHSDATMINYFFNMIIVSVTFLYSRVVKSVMRNFYEAKYMYWTLCQTFVLWFTFFTLYFKSDLKVFVFSTCVSANTLLHLLLIFFPKMYIIWFNPEMNDLKCFYHNDDYQLDTTSTSRDDSPVVSKKEKKPEIPEEVTNEEKT